MYYLPYLILIFVNAPSLCLRLARVARSEELLCPANPRCSSGSTKQLVTVCKLVCEVNVHLQTLTGGSDQIKLPMTNDAILHECSYKSLHYVILL